MGDLRYSLRVLLRRPGFSGMVVGILALGIGANTAVFSLINGILLRPFPYREPDRLVQIQSQYTKTSGNIRGNSLPDIDDWYAQSRALSDVGGYLAFNTDLLRDGPASPLRMSWLTPASLQAIGVNPILGRLFRPEEDRPGSDSNKATISHRLWQTEFGGDTAILGRTLRTGMGTFEVIGVMPPGFQFPDQVDLWAPIQAGYNRGNLKREQYRSSRPYAAIGRLRPGRTLADARADLEAISLRLEQVFPKDNVGVRPVVTRLRDAEVGNIRPYLLLLLGAAALVVLICCANVANLLLARSVDRSREFALRAALGAGANRLVRSLLLESVILSLAGGVLGLGLAFAGVELLPALIPVTLPFWMRIEVDGAVLAFNLAASVLTGLIFGIAPALALSRPNLANSLKEGSRASIGGGAVARFRDGLVVAEIALALTLLTGAGLLLTSFLRLQNVDLGFQPDHVITARVSPFRPGTVPEKIEAYSSLYRQVLDQVENLPGVEAAGGAVDLPFTGSRTERFVGDITVRGQADGEREQSAPTSTYTVSPGYFRAMGIPLLRGRTFTEADDQKTLLAVMISARTAELLWPGQDPIGRQLRWGRVDVDNQWPWHTVIGVVGNVKSYATDPEQAMEIYYSYRQRSAGAFSFTVRTRGNPEGLVSALRNAIQRIDKDTAVVSVKTLDDIVSESLWQRRLWSALFALFAAVALMLAAAGIYAVMSYLVSQRTREIGIRIALGAQPASVIGLIMSRGLILTGAGIGLGFLASQVLAHAVRSLLFGVGPAEPMVLVVVAAILGSVTAAACYVPARRALRVDPVDALRAS
jgi:putative ABC transport system permease protein